MSEKLSIYAATLAPLPLPIQASDAIVVSRSGVDFQLEPATILGTGLLTGEVQVRPVQAQGSGPWSVIDPYGNAISTVGTISQGLQEAINAAVANGWRLSLKGPGPKSDGTQPILLTVSVGGLYIGPQFFGDIEFSQSVAIHFAAPGNIPLVDIDSHENCKIIIESELVRDDGGTGPGVSIHPRGAVPVTGNITFVTTELTVASCSPGTGNAGVLANLADSSITNNSIRILDVNGGTWALDITDPGAANIAFEENYIFGLDNHSQTAGTVRVGRTAANQANLRHNTYHLSGSHPVGAGAIIFETWGSRDHIYDITGTTEFGAYLSLVKFHAGTVGNVLVCREAQGAGGTTFDDAGVRNLIIEDGNFFGVGGTIENMPIGQAIPKAAFFQPGGSTGSIAASGVMPNSVQLVPTGTPASTVETQLQHIDVPANTLNANGRTLHVHASGTVVGNGDNKRIKLKLNTTAIFDSVPFPQASDAGWVLDAYVYRAAGNIQVTDAELRCGVAVIGVDSVNTSETDSNIITVQITAINGSAIADEIVCKALWVEVFN